MAPAIVTDDLTKHFGSVRAVDGLSLEVAPGEVFGFLGPNGAGKTTTIRVLLDLVRPTRGSARILGRSPVEAEARRGVGYLPAELNLDPRYRIADVIDFYGGRHGTVDPRWAAQLIDRFDLDPARPFGQLSTGNKRKFGIVHAFVHRPRLVLLDEPTSGLDPLLQHEFHRLVREAVDDGTTVFLSSHVLPEVEVLADRVAILREGRLVALDSVAALRRRARQRIDLHLDEDAEASPFAAIPGVVEARAAGTTLHLVVEGSVDAVVKAAASVPVVRIVSHDADLEDVFLSYYRDGG